MTQDTFPPILFDSKTDTLTYPDGIKETLLEYQKRKHQFEYIRSLQDALQKLKVLYQNPGCLTKEEYYAAKSDIEEEFDFWEANLFIEFEDTFEDPFEDKCGVVSIGRFTGVHRFLSNFYESPIEYEGISYPTVEHAFQAAKTRDSDTRQQIANMPKPSEAKAAGNRNGILKDFDPAEWELRKDGVMEELLRIKFQDPKLKNLLIQTGGAKLIEGNTWGDTYWGVNIETGEGANKLGVILEGIRSEIAEVMGRNKRQY